MIANLLLILGWLIIVLALLAFLALICAASWLKCGKCQGWHDGECENVDWRTE